MKRTICLLLTFVMAVSACSVTHPEETTTVSSRDTAQVTTTETTEATTTTTTAAETTPEPTKAPEPIKFNPHVYSKILSDEFCTEEYWEALYNCIDALRAGEDSFECKSEKAYKFATDEVTLGALYPAACTFVKGSGFKDGKAKIKYKIDKDEFLERTRKFEAEIERMLNEAIRSDYSDFEKLLGLYQYIGKHFSYDYATGDSPSVDEFGNYACLMNKDGICTEIAAAYAYLLLQVGVEALEVEEFSKLCHAWTYVVLDGRGYFVDATWSLTSDPAFDVDLQYFLQTDEERAEDGCDVDEDDLSLVYWWKRDYDREKYKATDDKYRFLHDHSILRGIYPEEKMIRYYTMMGEDKEYNYGDL